MTDGDAALDAQLETLRTRGRKRMSRYYIGSVAIVLVVGVSVALIAGSGGQVHHHNIAAIVAGIVFGALAMVVWLWLGRRRWSKSQHVVAMAGLDRRRRKQVVRDVRRGIPSDDPLLRTIEVQQAIETRRQARWRIWIFPVLIVLEIVNAIVRDSAGARIFYGLLAAFMVAMWVYQLAFLRRARAFPTDGER